MTDARTFPNSTASIVRARRFAHETLPDVDREVVEAIAVMVSELATNAVRHAASEFTLSIDRGSDAVRVAVTDTGDRLPNLRSPAPTDRSGRGLQIVDALSDDWGVTELPGHDGKTVWFVLALDNQGAGTEAGEGAQARMSRPHARSGGAELPSRSDREPSRGPRNPAPECRARGRRPRVAPVVLPRV
jgi:anti-sigma regulatory factor (Ser/Thr protein kinase)